MTHYGQQSKLEDKLWVAMTIFCGLLLFVALSQPIWNANNMIKQQTEDCKKVGGVQIIDHGIFGDTYSCQPRLDKGVIR